MPSPVLSQEQWREVERAAVGGVPFTELARQFGVTDNVIRQRAFWKKWPVPNRVLKLKAEYLAARGASDSESTEEIGDNPDRNGRELTASNVMAETLAEIGQKGALSIAGYVGKKLKQSVEGDLLSAPDNWKTFSTAFGTFAKATGLDKPQAAVQVQVWGGDWTAERPVDAD